MENKIIVVMFLMMIIIGSFSTCVAKTSDSTQKISLKTSSAISKIKSADIKDDGFILVRGRRCFINATFNNSFCFIFDSFIFDNYDHYIRITFRGSGNKITLTYDNKEKKFECDENTIIHILGFNGEVTSLVDHPETYLNGYARFIVMKNVY